MKSSIAVLAALALGACAGGGWKPIFNGRNLDGWTPKIAGQPAGVNWRDTFVVKDGVLRVSYDNYPEFRNEFAHLVYDRKLSDYRLRFEYRFIGQPAPGAPSWAQHNSGVMLHGQAAADMAPGQSFPISIEAQLLGQAPGGPARTTGNLCTPGTTVTMNGVAVTEHCRNSAEPARPLGQWVKFEVEVLGGRSVRQFVDGKLVMEYADIATAPSEFRQFANIDPGARQPEPLGAGFISLQGESSPIEFRNIELMELAAR